MNNWLDYPRLKCVVLCAGGGRRAFPLSRDKAKVMIPVKKKPILDYVVNYWKRFTNDFIFVVKYRKEQVIGFAEQLPIDSQFVEQKELKGIAHALSYTEDLVPDRFIVVLGDCIYKGKFNFPEDMEQGIGVWRTKNAED
ncbi:NTP transferase domain-containing protein, partial [bacterium]|nr:NTP transferase domain-containing protein [bacterium]